MNGRAPFYGLTPFSNRDPIEERGGATLYGFVRNDAINALDCFGLWADHDVLTKESFDELSLDTTAKCKKRLLDELVSRNLQQDSVFFGDLTRHFNRDPNVGRDTARWDYGRYLQTESQTFNENVTGKGRRQCKRALLALGHLLHSWQDFFAHSIHATHGWNAWENGGGGTPDELGSLYPSSYPGEHPPTSEPIHLMHPDYGPRRRATVSYVTPQLRQALATWLNNAKCKCACEEAWWF